MSRKDKEAKIDLFGLANDACLCWDGDETVVPVLPAIDCNYPPNSQNNVIKNV